MNPIFLARLQGQKKLNLNYLALLAMKRLERPLQRKQTLRLSQKKQLVQKMRRHNLNRQLPTEMTQRLLPLKNIPTVR